MSSKPTEGDSTLEAVSTWTPSPIAPPRVDLLPARMGDFGRARAVAVAPFVVLGVIQLLIVTIQYAPETRTLEWLVDLSELLAPIAGNDRGAITLSSWDPWPTTALLASLALAVVAHGKVRLFRPLTFGLAGLIVVSMLAVLIPLLDPSDPWWVSAALLTTLVCGTAIRAPALLAASRDPRPNGPRLRFGWVVAFALLVYPPVAIGRVLYGDGIHRRLLKRGTDEIFGMAELHVWYWLVGVSVGVAVWSVIQLIPPYRGRTLFAPVLALITSVVAIQLLGGYAMEATEQLRDLLRS